MSHYALCCVLICLSGILCWSCAPKGAVGALSGKNGPSPIVVFPRTLYSGANEITVRSQIGLARLTVQLQTLKPELVRIERVGNIPDCMGTWTLRIWIASSTEPVMILLGGKDCDGGELQQVLLANRIWSVDRVVFPEVEVGKTSCGRFKVASGFQGEKVVLDSITLPESLPVTLGSGDEAIKFPVEIPVGREFGYEICFTGREPGDYRFPVTTWMRREEPAGRLTTYPVADTAIVRVVGKPEE